MSNKSGSFVFLLHEAKKGHDNCKLAVSTFFEKFWPPKYGQNTHS